VFGINSAKTENTDIIYVGLEKQKLFFEATAPFFQLISLLNYSPTTGIAGLLVSRVQRRGRVVRKCSLGSA